MLNFDELKDALSDGDDEPFEARKADVVTTDTFVGMPEGVIIHVLDDYFPESTLWREKDSLIAEITEHIYTKYWEHKWHGRVYAEAMIRAIKRFIAEGHPFTEGSIENDDDPHIFIRWQLRLPATVHGKDVIEAIDAAFDLLPIRITGFRGRLVGEKS